jgi:hypothetical protein
MSTALDAHVARPDWRVRSSSESVDRRETSTVSALPGRSSLTSRFPPAGATAQGSSEVATRHHNEGGSLLRPHARSPRCGCKELTPGAARVIDMESNQVSRLASWCYRSLETWITCGEKATLLGKDVEPRRCAVGNGIAVSCMDQVPARRHGLRNIHGALGFSDGEGSKKGNHSQYSGLDDHVRLLSG